MDHGTHPPITAVARDREVEGDLLHWDMGEGLGFRPGTFDGVISISALQWLCNADRKSHHPPQRLYRFFSSLYACMVSELIAHKNRQHSLQVCALLPLHRPEAHVLCSSSTLKIQHRYTAMLATPLPQSV